MTPTELQLYPGEIPNSIPNAAKEAVEPNGHTRNITNPTLTVYLSSKERANGTAVIILPGGSYEFVSFINEGTRVAEQFVNAGITSFILKYRLPDDKIMQDKTIGSLQDAQQAIKMVRQNAGKWNIDPARVGIVGFSAGGHLASMAGTHFNKPVIDAEGISLRPDFMVLLYPVISFSKGSTAHLKSLNNLMSETSSTDLIFRLSTELHVTPETPPTFIMHAADDEVVTVENAYLFHEALKRNDVPSEILIYPKGGHGFGIKNPFSTHSWIEQCFKWMKKLVESRQTN